MGGRAPAEPFRGPAADSRLGEAFLDVLPLVSAVGFAADVSQHLALCGVTWRRGNRGATNDMLVQSQRRQCGAVAARAAGREDFARPQSAVSFQGTTQLMRAAQTNDVRRVRQLVQLGAKLHLVDASRFSALHWACWEGHELVAKALLDGKFEGEGADIEQPGGCHSMTPLMFAAGKSGNEAVVRLLLSRGADAAAQSELGYTAWAYGSTPEIQALLDVRDTKR